MLLSLIIFIFITLINLLKNGKSKFKEVKENITLQTTVLGASTPDVLQYRIGDW